MATPPSPQRERVQKAVPALIDYTDKLIFGDVWERPALSKRDRSLITVAGLIATYRPEQLEGHLGRALDNGVTAEELSEVITHLAFYTGWPGSMTAGSVLAKVLEARQG